MRSFSSDTNNFLRRAKVMKNKPTIQIEPKDKAKLVEELTKYFNAELDYDLSNLEGEMFLDFLNEKIGTYFYNQGVLDSMKYLNEKTEELVFLIKED